MSALFLLVLLSCAAGARPLDEAADALAAQVRAGYAFQRSTEPATLLVGEFRGAGGLELSYLLRARLSSAPFTVLHPDSAAATAASLRLSGAVLEKTAVAELWDSRNGRVIAAASSALGTRQAAPPTDPASTAGFKRPETPGRVWISAGTFLHSGSITPHGSLAWRTPRGRWEASLEAGGFSDKDDEIDDHGGFGSALVHNSLETRFYRAKFSHILPLAGPLRNFSLRGGAGLGAYVIRQSRVSVSAVPSLNAVFNESATHASVILDAGLSYRLTRWLEAQFGGEYATERGNIMSKLHYGGFAVKGGLAARLFPIDR